MFYKLLSKTKKIKLKHKLIMSYTIIFASFMAFFAFFSTSLIQTLSTVNQITPEQLKAITQSSVQPLLYKTIPALLLVLLITIYTIVYIIRQISEPIQEIIKNLDKITNDGLYKNHFSNGNTGIIQKLKESLHSAFSRMVEFDYLKANRITINTNIIRNIINDIEEGIVILDKNKIVKDINQTAEQHLKLTSGELLNKSFARFVNNTKLIKTMNTALKDGSNNVDESIEVFKGEFLLIDFLTYLDKDKDTAGIVLVIKEKKIKEQEFQPEQTKV